MKQQLVKFSHQEHSAHVDKIKSSLESQLKEMQAKLEQAELNAAKGNKRVVQSLEQRVYNGLILVNDNILIETKRLIICKDR